MKIRKKTVHTESRERVLDVADRLFAERGYASVTLRDIAEALDIRHTSLYHHVPGGKESLFIEVTERNLKRHETGLIEMMHKAKPNIQDQLNAAAAWLLSQTPMDLVRMSYSDTRTINPTEARRLAVLTECCLLHPILHVLQQAQLRDEIRHPDLGLITGGLLGMIESLHAIPEFGLTDGKTRLKMAEDLIHVMLNGIRK